MIPFYHRVNTNFGDHMNSWLWPELVPELLGEDGLRLVGIGSILSRNLDLVPGRKVVFGSGSGYSSLPSPEQAARWRIYCVRGPLTARFLGLEERQAITDGAWLVNRIPRHAAVPTARKGTVFVPHWQTSAYGAWAEPCRQAGFDLVDPLWDCGRVFDALAHAELAVVESLHGAILADYYRTPWIAVATPSRILKFKWLDWCGSLGLDYAPYALPPSDRADALFQSADARAVPDAAARIFVSADTFDVQATPPPPPRAGAAYRMKVRAKGVLRRGRGVALKGLHAVRATAPFRAWNARRTERLAAYLRDVARQAPTLSPDAVRDERIARLNEALERMRADYLAGRI